MTLATLFDIFWDPGASETVKANLLKYSKAAVGVKVKARPKKSRSKKLKCSESHEMQDFEIKNISPYKTLLWT